MKTKFEFKAEVWEYNGKGAWHFVTLPVGTSEEIDFFHKQSKRGWGSLKVRAKIGNSEWNTSIFPDKERNSYLLPIKADIRKSENIHAGDTIKIEVEIVDTNF